MIDILNLQPTVINKNLSGYITYLYGENKIGKAQPNDTLIPTPNGYKKLGDLKVGDYVFDRKGKPTKITHVFPRGELEAFEVTLTDGRKTICNDEHIWTTYTSRGNFKNRTLKEMMEHGISVDTEINGKKTVRHKFSIPVANAVEYEEKELRIDPYVFGLFLGDGCCKQKNLTISSENDEIPNYIKEKTGFCFKRNSLKNYNWNFYLDEKTMDLGVHTGSKNRICPKTTEFFEGYEDAICVKAQNKYIPNDYKYGSINQRLEILKGLMDTDGSIQKDDYRVSLTSTSYQMILDVKEILESLGYPNSTIIVDNREDKYTNGKCYCLAFNIPNEDKIKFFNLKRKKKIAEEAALKHKRKDYSITKIKSAKDLGYKTEMTCIMVDNDEHLYLTNNFIVTHNSTLCKDANALILATEAGYSAIAGAKVVPIKTWGEFKMTINQLKKKEAKAMYEIVAIDTVDFISNMVEKYVCSNNDVDTVGQIPHGKGWNLVKNEVTNALRGITTEGYGLLLIGHAKETALKKPDGTEYNKIIPSVSSYVNRILMDMADTMCYCYVDPNTHERLIQIRSEDGYVECGSRFAYIESILPFGYESLTTAMEKALTIAEEKGEKVSYDTKIVVDDTPTYEQILTKGNQIVTELLNKDPNKLAEVNKIVEEVLGKGKKFSECGPNQVEAMMIIVDKLEEL